MQNFKKLGIWWIPEKEDKEISGELTFHSNKSLDLKFVGGFTDSPFGEQDYTEIICGLTDDNKKITLYRCYKQPERFMHGYSPFVTIYSAMYCFIGILFNDISSIRFDKISIRLNGLKNWLGFSGWKFREEIESGENIWKFHKTESKPESWSWEINTHLKLQIRFLDIIPLSMRSRNEMVIEEIPYFHLELYKKENLETTLNEYVVPLERFISFAIDQPIRITELEFHVLDTYANNREKKIQCFFPRSKSKEVEENLRSFKMLFSFGCVKDNFGDIITKWFEKHKKFQPIFDIYVTLTYKINALLYVDFLLTIQALEVYHRTAFSEKRKYTLKDRLKELFRKNGNLIQDDIPAKEEKEFIDYVVNARNYYTHYDNDLNTEDTQKLSMTSYKLRNLLIVCILKEISLPDKQIFSNERLKEIISNYRKVTQPIFLNVKKNG